MKLCVVEGADGNLYARENEQRLLRNMDVHVVVLDLLKIPYDKVREWVFCLTFDSTKVL
jgi:hypothetical protein